MAVLIPKLIHRIWIGGEIPPEFVAFGRDWERNHPGWTVKLWTEADLWPLRNQRIWDAAPSLTSSGLVPRMRSDIWRLEILARYGGLYVDTDFVSVQSIEQIIDGLDCFAAEEMPGLIANGLMGATAGHPFIERLISELSRSVERRQNLPPWRTTGPEFLTRTDRAMPGYLALLPTPLVYPYHHSQLKPDGTPPPIGPEVICHHVWASVRRSVSVIVPFRAGCPWREASKEWTAQYWAQYFPSWQIVYCTDDGAGAWSKAQAIRNGVRQSYGDVLVIADADTIVTDISSPVALVGSGHSRWAVPHTMVYRLSQGATEATLSGSDPRAMRHDLHERHYGLAGGGMLVVHRDTLEACPPDPRFRGWGGEDEALGLALRTLHGPEHRGTADLIHLWHPLAQRKARDHGNDDNQSLVIRYRQAAKLRPQMAALVAEHSEAHHG